MKKRNIAIILAFLAAIAALAVLPNAAKKGPAEAAGAAPAAFSVKTEAVARRTIQDYIEANGDVVVDSTVKVYPQVSGEIRSVKVALGSVVAKGQLIAEIDPSTPGSAYAINAVHAPIAGTVIASPLPVGSKVGSSTAIAELGDVADIELETMIPERYVGGLKAGLAASVSFQAYPGEAFAATVTRVSPVLDASSRTKTIRLRLDRYDSRVAAGMFAKIKLYTASYGGRLSVSEGAVLEDSTGPYAFVVQADGTVTRRAVSKGVSVDGIAEIRSGLEAGELVVVEGASVLADGAAVRDVSARAGASK